MPCARVDSNARANVPPPSSSPCGCRKLRCVLFESAVGPVGSAVRHIGIGVSYARRRLAGDGPAARALISELVDGFRALGERLLESTSPELAAAFVEAYGAEPATLWAEVQSQLQLRLRSIADDHRPGARAAPR